MRFKISQKIQLLTGADYAFTDFVFLGKLGGKQNIKIITEAVGQQSRNCTEEDLFEGGWYFGLFRQQALDRGSTTVYVFSFAQISKAHHLHVDRSI